MALALATMLALAGCAASPTPAATTTEPPSAAPAATSAAAPSPTAAESSRAGTRDDPHAVGERFRVHDWEVVLGTTELDATDLVVAQPRNEAPPVGFQFIRVPVEAAYRGADSFRSIWLQVEYLAADGEMYSGLDTPTVVDGENPDRTLASGESATWDEYIAVPTDGIEDGLLRVHVGSEPDDAYAQLR